MSTVWVVRHSECETLGLIAPALQSAGIVARDVCTFEGQPVPHRMGDAAALIVLGGPMGVYEQARYPFLRHEIDLLHDALRAEKPILGVCLGSQLLAAALGAKVTKGKSREIGWHRVTVTTEALSDPLWAGVAPSFMAYHWHGDLFDLPPDAVSLASSELTAHQAFRYGRHAYGFLFHLEVTAEIISGMVQTFAHELRETGITGDDIIGPERVHLPRLQRIGKSVFARWAGLVGQRRNSIGKGGAR